MLYKREQLRFYEIQYYCLQFTNEELRHREVRRLDQCHKPGHSGSGVCVVSYHAPLLVFGIAFPCPSLYCP